ncbi:MAG: glycerophosphodiester phosphodiesterase [Deltaproteobacteria bacterium]|nr:glycerophosphodiester phosphodiesterase [Deltaproteobacteria bacterium]
MHDLIEKSFLHLVDAFYAKWPQRVPTIQRLKTCKIISHRGQHDNRTVFENTLEAFDAVEQGGGWGLEFDIRWTRDLKPVVFHDRDLSRIFRDPLVIQKVERWELRKKYPLIPTLEAVLEKYGRRMHLMVELKQEHYPDPQRQAGMLSALFSGLEPVQDYHFLSLEAEMFAYVDFVPSAALLPVSQLNFKAFSRLALARRYAGVAGHYLFIGNKIAARHKAGGQHVGTGYPRSENCLFRELNRGVEWVFTNHAVEMQNIIYAHIGKVKGIRCKVYGIR